MLISNQNLCTKIGYSIQNSMNESLLMWTSNCSLYIYRKEMHGRNVIKIGHKCSSRNFDLVLKLEIMKSRS